MRYRLVILAFALAATLSIGATETAAEETAKRIVSIGGSVTEIIYALGQEDRLVARDTTSMYPQEANTLPDIGYIRALSPEGVLSVDPDMIISLEGAGPPEAVAVLRQAGVSFVEVPAGYNRAAIVTKIRETAIALGVEQKGEILVEDVEASLDKAAEAAADMNDRPRVLFVLSMQGGRILAGGSNTHADGIVRLAGGINAMSGVAGYKQVTDEAVIEAQPDVILMMDRRGDHSVADGELFGHPAIAPTPAAKTRAVIRMDGLLLLGFGPRTGEAALELGRALQDAEG